MTPRDTPGSPPDRSTWLALGGVVALALAARALSAAFEPILFNDGPRFIELAEAFESGDLRRALAHDFPPLTSLLMLALAAPTGIGLELAGKLVSVLSGGVAVAALYLLAREWVGTRGALIAGLLFAVHPRMVAVGRSVQSDGLHLALFLVAVLLAWRALASRRPSRALASGLACGLAYLARPEGLAVAVVTAVWLGADVLGHRLALRRAVALAAAFALGLLLTAGPYFATLRSLRGEWTLSQKKSVVSIVRVDAALASQAEPTRRLRLLIEAGGEVVSDGLRAAHPVILMLCLFGLRRGWPERSTLFLLSFLGLFLFLLLGVRLSAAYVSRRHWMPVAALLVPLAARGALRLHDTLQRRLPRARVRAVPALAGALLLLGLLGRAVAPEADPDKRARKAAALWLREHAPGHTVAARRSRLAYYAEASRFLPVPEGHTSREVLEGLRAEGVEYVIVDARHLGEAKMEGATAETIHRVPYAGGEVLVLHLQSTAREIPLAPAVSAGAAR